ncbi:orotate phosphoribosyltransferase [Methylophilus sp. Leaf414]|uniref:orotate phosphoribosyltransferase n=1 Tax=Methylophilus sp. Leaf414 TaxID=1736371 RepID=UPI0006FA077F|nr:orotate phosphoribosyltransferase [Methylophilus sp. Leaf414]KQT36492.1 orotate phosphoribosyltransferase [Methylophilus sp. Leaf414]
MTANTLSADFIAFSIQKQVLRFGQFKTKAGRLSPYFFNAGLFDDGESLLKLGEFYAHSILQSELKFDMLFGPAYKGIPLVAAISIAFARMGHNYSYAYNRKEAKDHGEGGTLVGATLKGRVLIIDDVISAGTSIRESVEMIRQAGAVPCGVSIALDRQEKGLSELSAVQEVEQTNKMPVVSIAKLTDLFAYLQGNDSLAQYFPAIQNYREKYCIV